MPVELKYRTAVKAHLFLGDSLTDLDVCSGTKSVLTLHVLRRNTFDEMRSMFVVALVVDATALALTAARRKRVNVVHLARGWKLISRSAGPSAV